VSFGEVVSLGKMRGRLEGLLQAAVTGFEGDFGGRFSVGISPHAPYTVEGPALRKMVAKASVTRAGIAMHLAEHADEASFLRDLSGPLGRDWEVMRKLDVLDDEVPLFDGGPIRWAQRWGLLIADAHSPPLREWPVILAHVNYCDDAE